MANIKAYRSGKWSDNSLSTSPWYSPATGIVYTPGVNDTVYANNNIIDIDVDITVDTLTNRAITNAVWIDGTTSNTVNGGVFTINSNITVNSNSIIGSSGAGNTEVYNTTVRIMNGISSPTIICNYIGLAVSNYSAAIESLTSGTVHIIGTIDTTSCASLAACVRAHGTGRLYFVGTLIDNSRPENSTYGIINDFSNNVFVTGNIIVGDVFTTTTNRADSGTLYQRSAAKTHFTGNILNMSATTWNTGVLLYNQYGYIEVIGNLTSLSAGACVKGQAMGASSAFTYVNNIITANIVNSVDGWQAVVLPRYQVERRPKNNIVNSNITFHSTGSLSAFSMPPIESVRYGVTYANNTLSGICAIPSPYTVVQGVSTDNGVGEAITTPITFFNVPLSALTTPNTVGTRIRTLLNTHTAGEVFSSFTQN